MDFDEWFTNWGNDAQLTAREAGCYDYEMDNFIENLFLHFNDEQHGELAYEDKIRYFSVGHTQQEI